MIDPVLQMLEDAGRKGWWTIHGRNCTVCLAPRPSYCDRGNWIATIEATPAVNLDVADGWPRYYLDFDRAKAEIEAWLDKRQQTLVSAGHIWQHTDQPA